MNLFYANKNHVFGDHLPSYYSVLHRRGCSIFLCVSDGGIGDSKRKRSLEYSNRQLNAGGVSDDGSRQLNAGSVSDGSRQLNAGSVSADGSGLWD